MAKEQDKESEKQALLREVESHKKQMLRWVWQLGLLPRAWLALVQPLSESGLEARTHGRVFCPRPGGQAQNGYN